jgi:hypothetical protein
VTSSKNKKEEKMVIWGGAYLLSIVKANSLTITAAPLAATICNQPCISEARSQIK